MDNHKVPYRYVDRISFEVYSSEEIQKLSVLEVTNPVTFDALGHPTPGGLYDPAFGPVDRDESCGSCGLNNMHCPGHMGHIKLPLVAFNPVFIRTLFQLLQGSCFNCHRLLVHDVAIQLTLAQLKALDYGLIEAASKMEEIVAEFIASSGGVKQSAATAELKELLDKCLQDKLSEENAKENKNLLVRNVLECRKKITKYFISEQLLRGSKKCMRCGTSNRRLILRNNSEIIFSGGSKKPITVVRKTATRQTRANDEYDEFGGEIEESETTNEPVEIIASQTYMTPVEARNHLQLLWEKDGDVLEQLFGVLNSSSNRSSCPMDIFFLECVLVPPSRFRPLSFVNGKKFENAHTVALNKVLVASLAVRHVQQAVALKQEQPWEPGTLNPAVENMLRKAPGKSALQKLHHLWVSLQTHVNCVYDCEMDKMSTERIPGVKQILEKKEGLFRKHMMGKRVNYAARSVISPDPYIMANEIGVPTVFATKLTFPQPVTPWNVQYLRQAVINGPDVHPGAVLVQDEFGSIIKLKPDDKVQREAIAKQLLTPSRSSSGRPMLPKIVYRHIQNGDVLLLNRQPTLHKPSIMAHKVRVLPKEKTLRLHYSNCKCYNADFDGDEMNAHCPQNELGRAEAYNIASVNFQYLVPKDGTPLSGLIQDHIISSSQLTIRGTFFTKGDYQELVFGALTFIQKPIKLLRPAIIKPVPLWSGKQIVSTIIINIIPEGKPPPTLKGTSQISIKEWQNSGPREWKAGGTPLEGINMTESEVIIRGGELLCGVLDKAHFGPTQYGLVHLCFELYGGETSTLLLTAIARLCTHFLQIHNGFTLGIEDILVTKKANKKRWRILKSAPAAGLSAISDALGVKDVTNKEVIKEKFQDAHLSKDDKLLKQIDKVVKSETDLITNEVNSACIPGGLLKKFPYNNLQFMVKSGAKGGTVNCIQISCLLGQIELEGRRVPMMLSGKTLPSFSQYDTSPRAGGFVAGRFLTGIRPQEYFFHCMAGREGLVDTAVKTSRSGYLQRCLIKHLEGLVINYDLTVRDSDGSVIQFLYGEDGLDILKLQMLKSNQFPVLAENRDALITDKKMEQIKEHTTSESIKSYKKDLKKWKRRHRDSSAELKKSPFTLFSIDQETVLRNRIPDAGSTNKDAIKKEMCEMWHALDKKEKKQYLKKCKPCPDPVNSKYRPDNTFGSISEKLEELIDKYISENPHNLLIDNEDLLDSKKYVFKHAKPVVVPKFQELMHFLNMKATAEPGEAVGLLAAQSIGEPSTQMTLNTFHFAGKGEMNVTLGIPRLREILMVASANIATPSMDLPLLPQPDIDSHADRLRMMFTRVYLKDVLTHVTVEENLKISKGVRYRYYIIRFNFLPYKVYKHKHFVNPSQILRYMESSFFKKLMTAMKQKLVILSNFKIITMARSTARALKTNETEEGESPAQQFSLDKPDDDDSSGAEDNGDGDTTSTKQRARHDQELEYEEPEEEERVASLSENDDDVEMESEAKEPSESGRDAEEEEQQQATKEASRTARLEKRKAKTERLQNEKSKRVNTVLNMAGNTWIVSYDFDTEREEWCEVTFQMELENSKLDMASLIDEEAAKAIVHEVPKISRAFLVKDTKAANGKMLKTEGVNFHEMFKYSKYLDLNRLYSNDIHAIANTYGIEAAARAVVREIQNVFAVYGIKVDPRHLSLIADYMTFDGSYKPCNRIGMENNCSPLQQMTFETTMNFMKTAALSGHQDRLTSPSSRIVLGRVVRGGTGCFDLMQPPVCVK